MSDAARRRLPTWYEWLYLVVGLFLVDRYFFFYDDSFVYFRYADNLLFLDAGLVYNANEYVEGYSSPLWMLVTIALRATELSWVVIVRAVAYGGFALFWWLAILLERGLRPEGSRGHFALAYLVGNYAVACSFSSGMETVLVQLGAAVFALFCLDPAKRGRQIAMAFLPLARPELALPWLIGFAFAWTRRRRLPRAMLVAAVLVHGAWLGFRVTYYADFLPNTYYVKSATRPFEGLAYLHDTLGTYGFYVWLPLAVLGAFAVRRRGGSAMLGPRLVMLLAAAGVAAYVVKIGGAPLHYRYLAFPFCLGVLATCGLIEAWLGRAPRLARSLAGPVVLALAMIPHPAILDGHPLLGGEQPRGEGGLVFDAAYHRRRIGTDGSKWSNVTPDALRAWRAEHPELRYGVVIVDGWCQRAYTRFDARVVHFYGLTDGILAHVQVDPFRPGHRMFGPLAGQLQELMRTTHPVHAVVTRAIEEGRAPEWLRKARASVELLERKIYNDHSFFTNLGLALKRPEPIEPPEMRRGPQDQP